MFGLAGEVAKLSERIEALENFKHGVCDRCGCLVLNSISGKDEIRTRVKKNALFGFLNDGLWKRENDSRWHLVYEHYIYTPKYCNGCWEEINKGKKLPEKVGKKKSSIHSEGY
jgi:hypothetical protein